MNDVADVSAVDTLEHDVTTEIRHDDDSQPGLENQGKAPAVDIAKAMSDLAASVKGAMPKAQEAKEPEMSEEEKTEFWAIYKPDATRKDFFQKWFRMNPDHTPEELKEAQEMWADVQKGLVRQSVVGARNIMQSEMAKLREEYAPIVEYYQTARAEATRGRFHSSFPALEDDRFGPVLQAVAGTLAQREFANEAEYFKVLAESTAEAIKKLIPDFDLGVVPNKPAGKTPKLPRTSAGGGGGAGGGARPTVQSKSRDDIDSLGD